MSAKEREIANPKYPSPTSRPKGPPVCPRRRPKIYPQSPKVVSARQPKDFGAATVRPPKIEGGKSGVCVPCAGPPKLAQSPEPALFARPVLGRSPFQKSESSGMSLKNRCRVLAVMTTGPCRGVEFFVGEAFCPFQRKRSPQVSQRSVPCFFVFKGGLGPPTKPGGWGPPRRNVTFSGSGAGLGPEMINSWAMFSRAVMTDGP